MYASSAFDKRGDVKDAGMPSSSDEEVDYNDDAEEKISKV
jgi:hypothetical protein